MSNQRPWPTGGFLFALGLWSGGLGLALALPAPTHNFGLYLAGMGLAAGAWLHLAGLGTALPPKARVLVITVGLLARAAAWTQTPDFSRDLDRYVYEGQVAWWGGPGFPFRVPPAEAPRHGVPAELLGEGWSRINHPEIPTLYPPLAQAVFMLAGAWSPGSGAGPGVLKALLIAFDLWTWWILARRRPRALIAYGLAPLLILETAQEGHADVLSAWGLAILIVGFDQGRPRLGDLGAALAALAKLNGLVVLPAALRSRWRPSAALLLLLLLALPLVWAGPTALTGFSAYAGRWRAGDGAFSVVLGLAEGLLGGDWRDLGLLTLTRHQLARALTLLLWIVGAGLLLRRPFPEVQVPAKASGLLILLLLLGPTFHPWYALWILPFAAFAHRRFTAASWLVAAAPLLHAPAYLEATTGSWSDPLLPRVIVHGVAWLGLLRDLRQGDGPTDPG